MTNPECPPKFRSATLLKSVGFALLLAFSPATSRAASPLEKISYKSLQAPNACLPDAIGFQNAYAVYQKMRQSTSWSRVLMVQSRTRTGAAQSHAFCVFALEGKLWAYDQVAGCRRVWVTVEEKADAMKIGRGLLPDQFDRALWADQSF
jgi:hypothetical protein